MNMIDTKHLPHCSNAVLGNSDRIWKKDVCAKASTAYNVNFPIKLESKEKRE